MDDSAAPRRARAPKVGHTKSRTGCARCKERRVKCDEATPTCRNCHRLGLECEYASSPYKSAKVAASAKATCGAATQVQVEVQVRDYGTPSTSSSASAPASTSDSCPDPPFFTPNGSGRLPENASRRLIELRLMHHWTLRATQASMASSLPHWKELWQADMPRLALEHDHLLHALLAASATDLYRDNPDETLLGRARDHYFALALQEHRVAIDRTTPANADVVIFAALVINLAAFFLLRERSMEPYAPPMVWLEISRSLSSALQRAGAVGYNAADAKLKAIVDLMAHFGDEIPKTTSLEPSSFALYQKMLDGLLSFDDELDDTACAAYVTSVLYIYTLRQSLTMPTPSHPPLLMICFVTSRLPGHLITQIRKQRPRALVTLAHFFAVISHAAGFHSFAEASDGVTISKREILAIAQNVPHGYQPLLQWPMAEVNVA